MFSANANAASIVSSANAMANLLRADRLQQQEAAHTVRAQAAAQKKQPTLAGKQASKRDREAFPSPPQPKKKAKGKAEKTQKKVTEKERVSYASPSSASLSAATQASAASSSKKKKNKTMLPSSSATTSISPGNRSLTKLQQKMESRLHGARFRFINEQLYTSTGSDAFAMFQKEPHLFDEYHQGFRAQVAQWPENPVNLFASQLTTKLETLRKLPDQGPYVVADMGCGEAKIAQTLYGEKAERRASVEPYLRIVSLDLVARNQFITAANIAKTGLESASVDEVIFCLSLMGTDFLLFLKEAKRMLKPGGVLKIAEVVSRFESGVDAFVEALRGLGFRSTLVNTQNKMFVLLEFVNQSAATPKTTTATTTPGNLLKACRYKKR